MTLSDFEVHPLSKDVALTTYRIFNEMNNTTTRYVVRYGNLEKEDGKLYFHQGTPAKF